MTRPPTVDRRRANFVKWMTDNGLNVAKVAVASKVPATTIYTFVQGHTMSMSGQNQDRIAHAYNLSVAEIFGAGVTRRMAVSGTFTREGVMRPYSDAQRVSLPPWLAGGSAPVLVCHVGDMPFVPGAPDWIVLFKLGKTKAGRVTGGWALIEMPDDRRLFRKVIATKNGQVELERLDGTREPGALMLAAMPMVAITPLAEKGPETGEF